jgi:hypothetical protein
LGIAKDPARGSPRVKKIPRMGRRLRRRLIDLGRRSGDPATALRFLAVARLALGHSHAARRRRPRDARSTVVKAAHRFATGGVEGLYDRRRARKALRRRCACATRSASTSSGWLLGRDRAPVPRLRGHQGRVPRARVRRRAVSKVRRPVHWVRLRGVTTGDGAPIRDEGCSGPSRALPDPPEGAGGARSRSSWRGAGRHARSLASLGATTTRS